jgi:hypothetical protein
MAESTGTITYFQKPGKGNTERTLRIAKERAEESGIRQIVVATTGGETGRRAAEVFKDYHLLVVTHSTGFREPDTQELAEDNRQAILAEGARLLTCQHAFGGVNRAIRRQLNTYRVPATARTRLRSYGRPMPRTSLICALTRSCVSLPFEWMLSACVNLPQSKRWLPSSQI